MKQVQPTCKYPVQINRQIITNHDSTSYLGQEKKKVFGLKREEDSIKMNNKNFSKKNKWNRWCLPGFVRRQLLRLFFIPLLIVLFLLTIALTFKQNNYQTNDYFYSKNIQINRKIRGVVPPLNESKQDIFGQYRIGLLQSFTVENRRMLENFRVQIWRNQTMRVSQIGMESYCWSFYKLKFYSSTIFIEKKLSYFKNVTIKNTVKQNQVDLGKKASNGAQTDSKSENQSEHQKDLNIIQNQKQDAPIEKSTVSSQAKSSQAANPDYHQKSQKKMTNQKPLCKMQKWSKLNQVLANSHIWTFAEGNFYLMQFSQNQSGSNGVLIMKMLTRYSNFV